MLSMSQILLKEIQLLLVLAKPQNHGLNQLKFKHQSNNSKLSPKLNKLVILRYLQMLYNMNLKVLSLKFQTVSALLTPNFPLSKPEKRT